MNSADHTHHAAAQSASLESYVVRIYRRETRTHTRLVGTVEIVADGTEQRFTGLRELQQVLVSRQARNGSTRSRARQNI